MDDYLRGRVRLSDALGKLDALCKSKYGPMSEYVSPIGAKNVYAIYLDEADYRRRAMDGKSDDKHVTTKTCKFKGGVGSHRNLSRQQTDRYFKHVETQQRCEAVEGYWDANSTSRHTGFGKGVCWTSDPAKRCGSLLTSPDVLRPAFGKYASLDQTDAAVDRAEEQCAADDECRLEAVTTYTRDCVPHVRSAPKNIKKPTAPMITSSSIGDELVRYIASKDRIQTRDLIGEGDRCKDPVSVAEASLLTPVTKAASDADQRPQPLAFSELDLSNKQHTAMLKAAGMKPALIDALAKLKKHGGSGAKERDLVAAARAQYERYVFQTDPPKKGPGGRDEKPPFLPSVPQLTVLLVADAIARDKLTQRGLLVWHSTGAGKTAVAAGIIDSFWEGKRDIIFVSSLDALSSNPPSTFHAFAQMFGRFATVSAAKKGYANRKVRFLSFAKLSNRVADARNKEFVDLNNSVLIVDEVHNLFRPLAHQKKEHNLLERELLSSRYPGLKIFILTATPGDNPDDVIKLLNLVRNSGDPVIRVPRTPADFALFTNQVYSLVSYFDMSKDDTLFPVLEDKHTVRAQMSSSQYAKYQAAIRTMKPGVTDYDSLAAKKSLNKYYEPARKYSNMQYKLEPDMSVEEFSAKAHAFLRQLKAHPNSKHYLYSQFYTKFGGFGHGVIGLAKFLDKIGYSRLKAGDDAATKAKRYILLTSTELKSRNPGEELKSLLTTFNAARNKDGEYCQVILASNNYNESIDLKDVSHVHIFEPFVNKTSEKQALGRAVRHCSFKNKDRSKGEWVVRTHRYMTELPYDEDDPNVFNVDDHVVEVSKEKYAIMEKIHSTMIEHAVDCRVLQKFHSATGQKAVTCKY